MKDRRDLLGLLKGRYHCSHCVDFGAKVNEGAHYGLRNEALYQLFRDPRVFDKIRDAKTVAKDLKKRITCTVSLLETFVH